MDAVNRNRYTAWREDPDQAMVARQLHFLRDSHNWSSERINDWRVQRFNLLLREAVGFCDFYAGSPEHRRLARRGIKSLAELGDLPIIDKAMIQSNYSGFIRNDASKKSLKTLTSGGSTGAPLVVTFDDEAWAKDRANTHFFLSLFGHDPASTRSVRLHGDAVSSEQGIEDGIGLEVSPSKLVLSGQKLDKKTISTYLRLIEEWSPSYIHAFPSSIFHLVKLAVENGLKFSGNLDGLYVDSENLYPGQRSLIQTFFSAPIWHVYGHTEGAIIGIPLPGSTGFHFMPQVGIVEIVNSDGEVMSSVSDSGEIIATGLNNFVFPLIRYRTGDMATIGSRTNRGSYLCLEKIDGRTQDFAEDANGRRVPVAPVLFDYNIDWSLVTRFQVHQTLPGSLTIRLVVDEEERNPASVCDRVVRQLSAAFEHQFVVRAELVQSLQPTSRGKFRYFVKST